MSLKGNVLANYLGQAWRALIGLIFIPFYIRYLGIEAYGLVGIFALLQAGLSLLDLGLRPTLGREMARYTAGARDLQSIHDLLRSVEYVGVAIAVAIAIGVYSVSGWLATNWLNPGQVSNETVADALAIMGFVSALRFIENIYTGSLIGLQRQVTENVVSSTMATVRSAGAVAVLAWLSPTIEAFFVWQGIVSLATIVALASPVYRILPPPPTKTRFSARNLLGVWRFAAGLTTTALLALLLVHLDKILVARLLPLETFAYYALASALAGALYMIVSPVCTAFYPRFTELASRGDLAALRTAYHRASQLTTVMFGTAAIIMIVFSERLLLLWTGDGALTHEVTPILRILAFGTLLNGLMWIPYQVQLAHGWTSLAVKVNVVAVILLVPMILWSVPKFGPVGAAWVWVALNLGYLLFAIQLMHQRVLKHEQWRWYSRDVGVPLFSALAVALLMYSAFPQHAGKIGQIATIIGASVCAAVVAALSASLVRIKFVTFAMQKVRSFCTKDGTT